MDGAPRCRALGPRLPSRPRPPWASSLEARQGDPRRRSGPVATELELELGCERCAALAAVLQRRPVARVPERCSGGNAWRVGGPCECGVARRVPGRAHGSGVEKCGTGTFIGAQASKLWGRGDNNECCRRSHAGCLLCPPYSPTLEFPAPPPRRRRPFLSSLILYVLFRSSQLPREQGATPGRDLNPLRRAPQQNTPERRSCCWCPFRAGWISPTPRLHARRLRGRLVPPCWALGAPRSEHNERRRPPILRQGGRALRRRGGRVRRTAAGRVQLAGHPGRQRLAHAGKEAACRVRASWQQYICVCARRSSPPYCTTAVTLSRVHEQTPLHMYCCAPPSVC